MEEHGPLETPRIPRAEQEPNFLSRLQKEGKVECVDEDWDGRIESLPPKAKWVLYPNGDLMWIRT